MIIIREHEQESLDTICYVHNLDEPLVCDETRGTDIGVDERLLAWFYIAPGWERDETSRRLVRLAVRWLGPRAWAVILASARDSKALLEAEGLEVIARFDSEAPDPDTIIAHLVRLT